MNVLLHALRILNTIRYIKLIQLYYQVWYRIKNRFVKIDWYNSYLDSQITRLDFLVYDKLVVCTNKYKGNNLFSFLNLSHKFNDEIDWNFSGHGKLWNYNLQYFDYLLDENIPVSERLRLLQDFSKSLLAEIVKPEPYPTSLRIINTIIFISNHDSVNYPIIESALKKQVDYLSHNLEYHLLANHLLENIFTLFISSYALRSRQLFNKAASLLKDQLNQQILPDGAHCECSPMYHSIILSKLLLCIDVARTYPEFDPDMDYLEQKAASMLGWINNFSFPDGSWALMNDAALDIASTTKQLNKASSLLGLLPLENPLKESGYRKLKGKEWEIIANVGNIIPTYQPGHAHADMLSFCLWYNGKQVIVDPGTSTYNNTAQRHFERCTFAHNTLSVDKKNQSDVWSAFRVGKRAHCNVLVDTETEVSAEHDGYKKIGIIHRRTFTAFPDSLVIYDEVYFNDKLRKNISIGLLFNSSFMWTLSDEHINGEKLNIEFKGQGQVVDATYAEYFNKINNTKQIRITNTNFYKLLFKFE